MILDEILRHKREEIAAAQQGDWLSRLRRAYEAGAVERGRRDFAAALQQPRQQEGRLAIIAEVKRASPSRGDFRPALEPLELAEAYAAHGADALSVLTDARFFKGSPELLPAIRARVGLPLLRKDFHIDPWQVEESLYLGADAILLIVAALPGGLLEEMLGRAAERGLAALVEVHTEEELARAEAARAAVIGVNNRNLHTFETSLAVSERLLPRIGGAVRVKVSESGIQEPQDLRFLSGLGADAVLIGEALVTAPDLGARLRELRAAGAVAGTGAPARPGTAGSQPV